MRTPTRCSPATGGGAAPAARRRNLRQHRRVRRRHRVDRRRDACRERRRARRPGAGAARRDAGAAAPRPAKSRAATASTSRRAEDAARDPRLGAIASDRHRRRRSWARTRCRSNIGRDRARYVESRRRRDDPGGRRRPGWPNGATCSARTGVFTPAESQAILEAGRRAGLKARIHADELGASGGSQVAAARRRALGRSPDLRADPTASPRWREPRRGRDASADGGVLPEAWTLRAGARAHRRGGAGRARDRRQPRRRVLAVDAVRDDARLLRDGDDVRGSPDCGDHQRRVVARSRTTRSAASSRASWRTP